ETMYLGNMDALRDWGFAGDYVEGMWRMLQQNEPRDFVLATGTMTSVRDFVRMAFDRAGITLEFIGSGLEEKAVDAATGQTRVAVDPRYFRPAEVEQLCGDPSMAKEHLGWEPKVGINELIAMMVDTDLEEARRDAHLVEGGFPVRNPGE
ncbi:MAG: GDP-mannose 4,6-dehydratase, partial [Spirochaetaceae bacterium]|nr:GDP-mannose 4,6-dehydratase [Spirochaetaceae bacterium]